MITKKSIMIPPVKAVTVSSNRACDTSCNNGTGISVFLIKNCSYNCIYEGRLLLHFSLADIPPNAVIEKAKIYLFPIMGKKLEVYVYQNKNFFDKNIKRKNPPQTYSDLIDYSHCSTSNKPIILDVLSAVKNQKEQGLLNVTVAASSQGCMVLGCDYANKPYLAVDYRVACPAPEPPSPAPEENIINSFIEFKYTLEPSYDAERYTPAFDASRMRLITFFIKNKSTTAIALNIMLSPDNIDYVPDKSSGIVQAGELKAFTTYLYAKYMKIKLHNSDTTQASSADIWVQAQSTNYALVK